MNPDIIAETLVRATRATVWQAIATGAGWDRWFTTGTTIDEVAGGRVHFVWTAVGPDAEAAEDSGSVVEWEEPSRFAFTWGRPSSTVTISLTDHVEGTRVTLVEHGVPADEAERYMACAVGWGEALTLMKFQVEHGVTYR